MNRRICSLTLTRGENDFYFVYLSHISIRRLTPTSFVDQVLTRSVTHRVYLSIARTWVSWVQSLSFVYTCLCQHHTTIYTIYTIYTIWSSHVLLTYPLVSCFVNWRDPSLQFVSLLQTYFRSSYLYSSVPPFLLVPLILWLHVSPVPLFNETYLSPSVPLTFVSVTVL